MDAAIESEPKHSFDLIVAIDVLEHFTPEECIVLLRKLRSLIKPGTGRFVGRFPNGDSPFSLLFQNGDLTHRAALGGGIVGQITAHSGWDIDYLGEPAWTATTWNGYFKNIIKVKTRRLFERIIAYFYYGGGGPSTWFWNYILVARPKAEAGASEGILASSARTSNED